MVREDDEFPSDAALLIAVLVMILGRQRLLLVGCDFTTASHAAVDPGEWRSITWPVFLFEFSAAVLFKIVRIFVRSHRSPSFTAVRLFEVEPC
jgi:hypothetical protein